MDTTEPAAPPTTQPLETVDVKLSTLATPFVKSFTGLVNALEGAIRAL
jgi:hypothetical protein